MLRVIVALSLMVKLSSAIVCTPELCSGATQPLLDCQGGIIKNGGFCGCTDVCAKVRWFVGAVIGQLAYLTTYGNLRLMWVLLFEFIRFFPPRVYFKTDAGELYLESYDAGCLTEARLR